MSHQYTISEFNSNNVNIVNKNHDKDCDNVNKALYVNNKYNIKISPMKKKPERKIQSLPPIYSMLRLPPNFDVIDEILFGNKDDSHIHKKITHVKSSEESNQSENNEPSSNNNPSGSENVLESNLNLFEHTISDAKNSYSHVSFPYNIVSEYNDMYFPSSNYCDSVDNNMNNSNNKPEPSKPCK